MKEFIEHIKGFALVYGVLAAAAIWLTSIDSKTFESAEQKVEVIKYVEDSPSPAQKQAKHLRDSMNTVHAIQQREKRTEMQRISDSIKKVNDSLIFDMVKRQTVQIEQIKSKLSNEINN